MDVVPKFSTIVDLFEQSVRVHAQRDLFGVKSNGVWSWIRYGEFKHQVEFFRAGLATLGVREGDRVGIISSNRVEWAITCFASLGLGAAVVPMYEAQLVSDWEHILRDSETTVLIVSTSEILAKVASLRSRLPCLKHVLCMDASESEPESFGRPMKLGQETPLGPGSPAPSDMAFLIYTSGTTGEPKGVMLSHENIASNVSAMHQIFDVFEGDRSLSFLPWAHCLGLTGELHALLSLGAGIAISTSLDRLADEISEVRPTILLCVPRVFHRIYDTTLRQVAGQPRPIRTLFDSGLAIARKRRAGASLTLAEKLTHQLADKLLFSKVRKKLGGRLRFAISGGAALAVEVAEFIDAMNLVVYEGYGLSEASPIANVNCPGSCRMGSVGRNIPGCRIAIDASVGDEPGRGEIVVYGPNVMKGYFRRPEETAAVMTGDGGLRTGDMGYVDEDGYLFITGRIKEQFKLQNGKYVAPARIEDRLKLSRFVANAYVYGHNRPCNVALIVVDRKALTDWASAQGIPGSSLESTLSERRVIDKYRVEIDVFSRELKGYERVDRFALISDDFTIENGMLTPSLKLKRHKVLERWREKIESLYA